MDISVATSGAHRVLIDGDENGEGMGGDTSIGDLLSFIVGKGLAIRRTDGYRVPLLESLWATAPYLHNGSVPTLADLLSRPEDRRRTFERHGFLVDTAIFGNDNGGHGFGSELSAADKRALIAYLESL